MQVHVSHREDLADSYQSLALMLEVLELLVRGQGGQAHRPRGASARAREDLPDVPYDAAVDPEQESCTLCMEQFTQAERLTKLPCGHLFHKNEHGDCGGVMHWLESNNTCPVCRAELEPEEQPPSETQQWECFACTFENQPIFSRCIVCNTARNAGCVFFRRLYLLVRWRNLWGCKN
jgi:E3 ubiquitin-protein ligase RNF115/126